MAGETAVAAIAAGRVFGVAKFATIIPYKVHYSLCSFPALALTLVPSGVPREYIQG